MVDEAALEGYRKFAKEELEKGVVSLRGLTESACAALEEMHVREMVCYHRVID